MQHYQHHSHSNRHQPKPHDQRQTQAAQSDEPSMVLIIGGHGGMSEHYRAVVEKKGLVLRHYEKRVPPGMRHTIGKVAAVIIMAGMVSHTLRDQVRGLVPENAPIVYLRTPSVSALRAAVDRIEG